MRSDFNPRSSKRTSMPSKRVPLIFDNSSSACSGVRAAENDCSRDHVRVSVGQPDNARPERDLLRPASRRDSRSRRSFVMVLDGFPHHRLVRESWPRFPRHMRVHSYLKEFIFGQRARLVQDSFGNKDLAHIMNPRRIDQIGSLFRRQAQRARDDFAVARHHLAVPGGVQFARFGGAAQGLDRFLQHLDVAVLFPAAQLLQRGDQFFQMLRAGVLALQEAFDVGRDLLALRARVSPSTNSCAVETGCRPRAWRRTCRRRRRE